VADAHRSIVRKVDFKTVCNLLGTPRARPTSVLSLSVASTNPIHIRAVDRLAASGSDLSGQAILDVGTQLVIVRQPGGLGTACRAIGMPLRSDSPIFETTASRGRIAPQFARNR